MVCFDRKIAAIKKELIALRRDLHRIPELGFQEFKTAGRVAEFLAGLGLEVTSGVGGTGVIGLLRGSKPGPTIALRACLDALPVVERSGLEYASENPGVMHACGHDGNMTFVLGAAKILSQTTESICGNVKFIFQPAEEETGGAAEIIKAGGLQTPDVDAIFTLHNWHGFKQGLLGVKAGAVLASSDIFHIKIIGKPGHGAWPHLAVDPVVTAADIISRLQNIISREIDPVKAAAISVCKIQGGTAVNIIPEAVTLQGTVRTLDVGVRDFIQTRIKQIVHGVTQAARASYEMSYTRVMPPVNNDPLHTARVSELLQNELGAGAVTDDFSPSMGCEEFSLFQEQVPGLFLFIGNDSREGDQVPLHSPDYVFNEDILPVGVKALCEIVKGFVFCG